MTETATAGATPGAGGATPNAASGPSVQPPQGDPAGAPGAQPTDDRSAANAREALSRVAQERDDLKRQLDELKSASQTDAEKAIAQARKEGATEALGRVQAQVRRSEVRAALTAAGVSPTLVDLAARADVFANLKVSDEGDVQGLDGALEAFRRATPDAFVKAPTRPTGDAGLGPRGTPPSSGTDLNTFIRKAAGRT